MGDGKVRDPHLDHKPNCSFCGSKEVRYLRRSQTIYCRVCGMEWPAHWVDNPPRKTGHEWEKGG